MARATSNLIRKFIRDEDGLMTHLALVVLLIVLIFSGMSLDTNNARRMKHILQTAADAAARGAILDLPDQATALTSALELANANLTPDSVNSAVTSDSVTFGRWNEDDQTFTATTSSPNAVRVTATRSTANSNPLPTLLLRMAGFQSWNIEVSSTAFKKATCETVDIATNGSFSITSNNDFYNSYCITANAVDLNSNNTFDSGNRIYVPSFDAIDFNGASSLATVVGRGTDSSPSDLTYGDIFEVNTDFVSTYTADVETLADSYLDPGFAGQPDYINPAAAVIEIDASDVKYTDFEPGRIYEVVCGGGHGSKAQIFSGVVISEIVMVSECNIQIGARSVLSDVVLVSRDTSNKSVYAASKVVLGSDDDCAEGGEVKIFTAGDFDSAANLEAYGAYISAVGEVHIAGKADGIAGLEIQANGDISFSAQASFGTCSSADGGAQDVTYALVR